MKEKPEHGGGGIGRFQIGLNVFVQSVAVVAIVLLVNYFAFNHYRRWDFSRSQKFRLADQTGRILKGLDQKLRVVVFFSSSTEIYEDVVALLKEYQYASGKKIEVEIVDPYRNFSRSRELQEKYRFGENEDVLILDYGGRTKFLGLNDLADFDRAGEMFGQPPAVQAFRGEQALSGAILELSEAKRHRVGVLVGQGGPAPGDPALEMLSAYAGRQNVEIEAVDLSKVPAIPDEVRMLFLLGPKYDLSEREIGMLRAYWEREGRLFVALDPGAYTPNLHAFLAENGVELRDDRVVTTVNLGSVTGLVRDVTATFQAGHKVSKRLGGVNTMFLGATQSMALDRAKREDLEIDPLAQAAEGYWGEVDHRVDVNAGGRVVFEPSRDHAAPLALAAAVEFRGVKDERVGFEGARMIVVGNGSFFLSDALAQVQPNVDFLMGGMNWLLDRDALIGIAPKRVDAFSLNLTEEQLGAIALFAMVGMPFAVAVLGFGVWLARRR